MSSIEKVLYSKPMIWAAMTLAALVALVMLVWGGVGVYKLTQLPPGPTAWHDADSTPLMMVAISLPLLFLFAGSIIKWVKTKEMPDKLVIWAGGIMVGLFVLADLAVK
jgi:hypothetical protein